MALIIKRKVTETWRDAVERRAGALPSERRAECLAAFDAGLADGASEAESAYAALAAEGLLWTVEGAAFTVPRLESDGRDSPHTVPAV